MAQAWPKNTAAGVWSTLGPYYATMPLDFARRVVEEHCPAKGAVLDPFCGRGSVPFCAKATGRAALGCDVSPVAYVYSAAKADPGFDKHLISERLGHCMSRRLPKDYEFDNDFMRLCFSREVISFLHSARRQLDWKTSSTDRTIMAVILTYLHDKVPYGLSNQMPRSRAMAPDYAIRWWTQRGMTPPELDPADFITKRIAERYKYGLPAGFRSDIRLGDSRDVLPSPAESRQRFDLLFTSPPYCGVADYRRDQWLRLWMLGEEPLPHSSDTSQKYGAKDEYAGMLDGVLTKAAPLLTRNATIYIRTDSRPFTRDTTAGLMARIWPNHQLVWRSERHTKSQTHYYRPDYTEMPGETDIIALPSGAAVPAGFAAVQLSDDADTI